MRNANQPDSGENTPTSGSEEMMANLRKDVTDWNKAKHANEGTASVATATPPARKRPVRAAKAPETPPQAPAADGKKQPFRMSYDGVSASQHAAARHLLGAR